MKLINTRGGDGVPDLPLDPPAVELLDTTGGTSTFSVTQRWTTGANETLGLVAIHYRESIGSAACEKFYEMPTNASTPDLVGYCICGYTDVNVYIRTEDPRNDTEWEECDACLLPDNEAEEPGVVAYYFEIPCDVLCPEECPPPEPAPGSRQLNAPSNDKTGGSCSPEVKMQSHSGSCVFDQQPISVLDRSGSHVKFSLSHTWNSPQMSGQLVGTMDELMVLFSEYPERDGNVECYKQYNVDPSSPGYSWDVACDATGYAEVEVFVSDVAFGTFANVTDAAIPSDCSASTGASYCSFVFTMPCEDSMVCPDDVKEVQPHEGDEHHNTLRSNERNGGVAGAAASTLYHREGGSAGDSQSYLRARP